jgi:hypothetical protein
MSETDEPDKKVIGCIMFGALVLVFLLTHFRIIKSGESHLLIFTISNDYAWALHPKTINTPGGDIYLPIFTEVNHQYGYLSGVIISKPLKYDLYLGDTKLDSKIAVVDLTPMGGIVYMASDDGQSHVIDGQSFVFSSYELKYERYDEYNDILTTYYIVLDFDQIVLGDGTTITINDIGPYCVLKITDVEWRLYVGVNSDSFILENAKWKEDRLACDIAFEPHFGKMLEYRETEPERRFGEYVPISPEVLTD